MGVWSFVLEAVTSIATVAAAAAAICALGTWRTQMVAARRADVAQQALTDAYAYRDFFNAARVEQGAINSPDVELTPAGTIEDLLTPASVRLQMAKAADRTLGTGKPGLLGQLETDMHRMRASFGRDAAAAPIEKMLDLRSDALARLRTIGVIVKRGKQPGDTLWRSVWASPNPKEPDDLTKRMDAAVAELEAICHPVLDARDVATSSWCDSLFDWLLVRDRGSAAAAGEPAPPPL
jgi:hypothetical protein